MPTRQEETKLSLDGETKSIPEGGTKPISEDGRKPFSEPGTNPFSGHPLGLGSRVGRAQRAPPASRLAAGARRAWPTLRRLPRVRDLGRDQSWRKIEPICRSDGLGSRLRNEGNLAEGESSLDGCPDRGSMVGLAAVAATPRGSPPGLPKVGRLQRRGIRGLIELRRSRPRPPDFDLESIAMASVRPGPIPSFDPST